MRQAKTNAERTATKSVAFLLMLMIIGWITPVDLVEDAEDETHPTVINICRFLQTLDDDDTSNGITITSAVRAEAVNMSVNFNLSVTEFEADVIVQNAVSALTGVIVTGGRVLVSATVAQFNMRISLNNEVLFIDEDGDGYSAYNGDCNDLDGSVNPDAAEICGDGVDQDCDGTDLPASSWMSCCFPIFSISRSSA